MDIIIFHALFSEVNLLQGDTVPLTRIECVLFQNEKSHHETSHLKNVQNKVRHAS